MDANYIATIQQGVLFFFRNGFTARNKILTHDSLRLGCTEGFSELLWIDTNKNKTASDETIYLLILYNNFQMSVKKYCRNAELEIQIVL